MAGEPLYLKLEQRPKTAQKGVTRSWEKVAEFDVADEHYLSESITEMMDDPDKEYRVTSNVATGPARQVELIDFQVGSCRGSWSGITLSVDEDGSRLVRIDASCGDSITIDMEQLLDELRSAGWEG